MSKQVKIAQEQIEQWIFTVQNQQVMLDYHLAELFQVETKRLNEQVKRNSMRFPTSFMIQLTASEWEQVQSQIATTEENEGLRSQIASTKRRTLPYAFTEQGVAMLSAVLRSETAITMSIQIMDAFVKMRRILAENALITFRLDSIERKQLETDQKFEKVFKALENKKQIPSQGVFFDGQIFDAYAFVSKLIKNAKKEIVLIDNYMDESTITHLSKKEKAVKVILLTKTITKELDLDIKKANQQYHNFTLKTFAKSHDRFLIIDNTDIFHLGASLKDLGKKWFAFSKMNKESVENILKAIEK